MKKAMGFTLVELIAIIVIMGIIIGIITPSAIKLIEKSKVNSFRESLRSIIRSTELYMEENNLKKLPDEGIYLTDNDLDIDYADGYTGIVKYVDGEVVLENIGNGKYCGNGAKDTLSISKYTSDCAVKKVVQNCFLVGTTDTAGDTITGFDLSNDKCDPTNISIPATINDVPIKYIAKGAFLEAHNYEFTSALFDASSLGGPKGYNIVDIPSNISYIGAEPYQTVYLDNLTGVFKVCLSDSGHSQVDPSYQLSSGDGYHFCQLANSSGPIYGNGSVQGIGIETVDFSNATNLVSIGENAFMNNYITGAIDLSSAVNLKSIGSGAFSANAITSLKLPTGLETIGSSAFLSNLIESVTLPVGMKNVAVATFADNQIKTLVLNDGLESISSLAFDYNQLSSITIPATVTSIGYNAFGENDDITTVNIKTNTQNNLYRFNEDWEDIGFPIELMKETPGGDYPYTLSTSSNNILNYVNGDYLITVPTTGTYKVQFWGAAGGGADPGQGGYGGYISANLSLTSGVTYKLVIGRGGIYTNGVQLSLNPSQGGGGAGYGFGGSGGGATILTISGSDTVIAVAGGGGGASDETYPSTNTVGNGGYLYSSLGNLNGTNSTYRSGGTQTAGGQNLGNGSSYGSNGSYLQGGDGGGSDSTCITAGFSDCNSGGGGGGGYYGGSGGGADTDAGSGGSSYVNPTYGLLNSETVPEAIPLKQGLGADANGENGYAIITFVS